LQICVHIGFLFLIFSNVCCVNSEAISEGNGECNSEVISEVSFRMLRDIPLFEMTVY